MGISIPPQKILENIPRLSYFQLNKIHFIIRHSQNLYEILLYKRYTIEKNPTQQHIYPLNQCDVYTKTTPVNPPPPSKINNYNIRNGL